MVASRSRRSTRMETLSEIREPAAAKSPCVGAASMKDACKNLLMPRINAHGPLSNIMNESLSFSSPYITQKNICHFVLLLAIDCWLHKMSSLYIVCKLSPLEIHRPNCITHSISSMYKDVLFLFLQS